MDTAESHAGRGRHSRNRRESASRRPASDRRDLRRARFRHERRSSSRRSWSSAKRAVGSARSSLRREASRDSTSRARSPSTGSRTGSRLQSGRGRGGGDAAWRPREDAGIAELEERLRSAEERLGSVEGSSAGRASFMGRKKDVSDLQERLAYVEQLVGSLAGLNLRVASLEQGLDQLDALRESDDGRHGDADRERRGGDSRSGSSGSRTGRAPSPPWRRVSTRSTSG